MPDATFSFSGLSPSLSLRETAFAPKKKPLNLFIVRGVGAATPRGQNHQFPLYQLPRPQQRGVEVESSSQPLLHSIEN